MTLTQRILLQVLNVGLAGALGTLCVSFGAHSAIFDIAGSFRVQFLVGIALLLVLSVAVRRWRVFIVLLVPFTVHGFTVFDSLRVLPGSGIDGKAMARSTADGPTQTSSRRWQARLLNSNLLYSNFDFQSHVDFVAGVDPDIIVFEEYTAAWDAALSKALVHHPYRATVPRESPFGVAIYSRWPIVSRATLPMGERNGPTLDLLIDIPQARTEGASASASTGGTLSGAAASKKLWRIIATHPPPPISRALFETRNLHLLALGDAVCSYDGPLVVAGDLNITPWSIHFNRFIERGRLVDARRGFGIAPSWPAFFYPAAVPIDHILVNERVQVDDFRAGPALGSDHRSVWADLVVVE